jgi:prepilin-type N-terminal cleavage/methylation domain-containing protein
MQLRKIFTHKRGFSLIEILVVTSIIAMLAGLGLIVGMDSIRQNTFQSEQRLLADVLEKARSRALHNMFESPHGVHIENAGYTIFRGSTYNATSPTNETFPKNPSFAVSGASDITFAQLSGNSSFAGVLMITDGIRSRNISLNNEGRIDW